MVDLPQFLSRRTGCSHLLGDDLRDLHVGQLLAGGYQLGNIYGREFGDTRKVDTQRSGASG